MRSTVQQLNWGLLLSRGVRGEPPPYAYRKAWRDLITVCSGFRVPLPYGFESKLEEVLQAMVDIDRPGSCGPIKPLRELVDIVEVQAGARIPQAQANALSVALQQIISVTEQPGG